MFNLLKWRQLAAHTTWVLPAWAGFDYPSSMACKRFNVSSHSYDYVFLISRLLGFSGGVSGFAKQRAQADGIDQQQGQWWCADPVTLSPNMRTLVMSGLINNLSADEQKMVQAALKATLSADMQLVIGESGALYLCLESSWQAETISPAQIIGGSIDDHLPVGNDARLMIHLMHEWQLALHALPANQAREQAGQSLISSLWLWGGGSLDAVGSVDWEQVITNDPMVAGLARYQNIAVDYQPGHSIDLSSTDTLSGRVLVVDPMAESQAAYDDLIQDTTTQTIYTDKQLYTRRRAWW